MEKYDFQQSWWKFIFGFQHQILCNLSHFSKKKRFAQITVRTVPTQWRSLQKKDPEKN